MTSSNAATESGIRWLRRSRTVRIGAVAAGLALVLGSVATAPALASPSATRQVHVEGHVFPVAKSPGVYRVIGGLVGTYKIRSERVIQGWTYWTTQISELADEALSALEEDLQRRSSGLTAREVDILDLVANGLSNAEIAERLVLSERTVHAHLRSIFDKLGVNTRTAAVHEASWLFARVSPSYR